MAGSMHITHVNDLVAIVNKPGHPKHGRIARIESHDHLLMDGTLMVLFVDGSRNGFIDSDRALEVFYRKFDKVGEEEDELSHGPRSFVHRYFRLTGQGKTQLNREYKALFGEDFVLENQDSSIGLN